MLIFSVVIAFLFCVNNSQQQPTPLCASPAGYDSANLTLVNYWTFTQQGGCFDDPGAICQFYFTFCRTLTEAHTCVNSSVCQLNEQSANLSGIGQYVFDPFDEKDMNGFYATFPPSQTIKNPYSNLPCNLSVKIEFDCDKNVPWLINGTGEDIGRAPDPLEFRTIDHTTCEYFIKFAYAGACYKIVPPATTTEVATSTPIDPPPSAICIPPSQGYDINILSIAPYWRVDIDTGCEIEPGSDDRCSLFIAFCKPFESLVGCNGASACIKYPNKPHYSVVVGNYSADPFNSYEMNGFEAVFPNGEIINNTVTNQNCPVSIIVIFDCDATQPWDLPDPYKAGIAPAPTAFSSVSSNSCQLTINIPYAGACIKTNPAGGIPGLSSGSILLIIAFSSIFAYLLVGTSYNKFVDKQVGSNVIPHYDFWVNTMMHALEGFIYVWRLATCQNPKAKEGKLLYDQA